MTIKSRSRKIGRSVRRITGLPLPIAMGIGKMLVRGAADFALVAKFPDHISTQKDSCQCCTSTILKGPKGSVSGSCLDEETIAREIRILDRLALVPFGTTVSAD